MVHFLVLRAARNRAVRQLRRLRKPRYALAVLVGLAYFYWIFAMNRGEDAPFAGMGDGLELLATLGLAVLALWWWISGGNDRALAFTPAEVNLLFTAPLERRDVIRYRILNAQLQAVATALILALVFGRGGQVPWLLRVLSIWTLFATLSLHQMGTALVHATAAEPGVAGLRRAALPILLFGAALAAVVVTLVAGLPAILASDGPAAILGTVGELLALPAPRVALAPLRAVVHPTFAADAGAWLAAFPWALLVLALHYVWVVRMDAAFEEAAAEAGRKRAQAVAAVRAGKLGVARRQLARSNKAVTPTRIPLAASGAPWRALVWKNLVSFTRLFPPAAALRMVAVLVVFGLILGRLGDGGADLWEMFAVLLSMATLMLTLMGAFVVRVDLRQDLERLEVLKTYPLSGRWLVAGEILASVATLTVLQLGLAWSAIACFVLAGADPGEVRLLLVAGALAPLLFVLLNAIMVTIQNAVALLYPDWSHIGRHSPQGIEAMGQNILTMLGAILIGVLSLLGPAVLAGILGGPVFAALGPLPGAVAAGVAFLAGLVVEVVWAVVALGDRFDALDPAAAGILH